MPTVCLCAQITYAWCTRILRQWDKICWPNDIYIYIYIYIYLLSQYADRAAPSTVLYLLEELPELSTIENR